MKKALITGITGQEGSYLAELLVEEAMANLLSHNVIYSQKNMSREEVQDKWAK